MATVQDTDTALVMDMVGAALIIPAGAITPLDTQALATVDLPLA
jgi:hypothetical protein